MKSLKKVLLLMLLFTGLAFIIGCDDDIYPEVKYYEVTFETNGGNSIEKVTVEEGKKVVKPANPVKEYYVFIGWYSDSKLTSEYDFNSAVNSDITIYAGWEAEDIVLVYDVELNNDLVLYHSNKEEKVNEKTEFYDLTQDYVVGDDNAWSVKPMVSFITYNPDTGETSPTSVASWTYVIEVLDSTGNKLDLETTDLIENIDNVNCTIDFAAKAIDDKFTVKVTPTGLTEKQLEKVEEYTTEFTFVVTDGYNVYDEKELSFIDNRTSGNEANAWKEFKEENHLEANFNPSRIILHKSMNITADDLPKYFFYQEADLQKSDADYNRALGSMKDYIALYYRDFKEDDEFSILGNYFTVSIESLREVVRDNNKITPEGEVISHSVLFRFQGSKDGSVVLENLNFIGNAPRVENTIKGGGLIMNKVEGPSFKIYNTISACYFITYFANLTSSDYIIEKCKAYDSFNSFVYNWGSSNVYIKDSEMIGAGGPVIIQDHVDSTASDGGSVPNTVITNSNLQSYVTGTEGWFTLVGASALVPSIKALDAVFNQVNRSFLKANSDASLTYFNLICINKSGSAESVTAEKVKGSLSLDGKAFNYGANDPYLAGLLDQTFTLGAPTFQSSEAVVGSGYAYFNGGLYDVTQTPITDPTNPLFSGDYLCIYFNGMAFVLGYGEMGQIYLSE